MIHGVSVRSRYGKDEDRFEISFLIPNAITRTDQIPPPNTFSEIISERLLQEKLISGSMFREVSFIFQINTHAEDEFAT